MAVLSARAREATLRAEDADQRAAAAEAVAIEAEKRLAAAEAIAATLREVVDSLRPAGAGQSRTGGQANDWRPLPAKG